MAVNRSYNKYMYETSPRKLKPDYNPQVKEKVHKKTSTLKKKNKIQKEKQEILRKKKQKFKCIAYLCICFAVLMAISFRNSQINESFSQLKNSEKELAAIQKENEQLQVSIENELNLYNLEQAAKEQLGMQKATNKQTIYVSLPKKDYVEAQTEEIILDEQPNIIQRIINFIANIYK